MTSYEIDGQVLFLPYTDKSNAFILACYPAVGHWIIRSRSKSIKAAQENVARTIKRFGNDGTKFHVVGRE